MKHTPQQVLIMAGGTGGHIFPGLAVADVLRNRGIEVRWLGAKGGMECEQVHEHGISLDQLRIQGVRGKGLMDWLALPFRLIRAVLDARSSMIRHVDLNAVSFGGYTAGPGGIAAWLGGVPLVVHEQNRVPGMTNRVLAKFAERILQAFPGTFPEKSGVVTCGNPVRKSVIGLPDPGVRFKQRSGPARLLVTGGSQGARSLNKTIPKALALLGKGVQPVVRHQAGAADAAATRAAYEAAGCDAEVHEFITDMAESYGWADLVICRAGALTISELAAAGVGAVLIPYPHAVDDHQTLNAGFLAEAGAAVVVAESELNPEDLAGRLEVLLADRQTMLEMAQAARAVAVTDAAEQVVAVCESWFVT